MLIAKTTVDGSIAVMSPASKEVFLLLLIISLVFLLDLLLLILLFPLKFTAAFTRILRLPLIAAIATTEPV
jgi:hypothetical protein